MSAPVVAAVFFATALGTFMVGVYLAMTVHEPFRLQLAEATRLLRRAEAELASRRALVVKAIASHQAAFAWLKTRLATEAREYEAKVRAYFIGNRPLMYAIWEGYGVAPSLPQEVGILALLMEHEEHVATDSCRLCRWPSEEIEGQPIGPESSRTGAAEPVAAAEVVGVTSAEVTEPATISGEASVALPHAEFQASDPIPEPVLHTNGHTHYDTNGETQ
jgi:hypothetical protein